MVRVVMFCVNTNINNTGRSGACRNPEIRNLRFIWFFIQKILHKFGMSKYVCTNVCTICMHPAYPEHRTPAELDGWSWKHLWCEDGNILSLAIIIATTVIIIGRRLMDLSDCIALSYFIWWCNTIIYHSPTQQRSDAATRQRGSR